MKRLAALAVGLLILVPTLVSLTSLRKAAPPPVRLGYQPSFEVTYLSSLEYRYLLSQVLVYDAIFYYGAMLERPTERPDYLALVRYLDYATRLNGYNIDAYYFGQAVLTWEVGMVRDMNVILERGVKKRTWDFYPPFFLGFNHLYFLHDARAAAPYMELAAKLNPQAGYLPTLVGRLYYQANRTEQAISYLKVVYEGTFNPALRRQILIRIQALESIKLLEDAVKRFEAQTGHPPLELADLVTARILKGIPPDPYGGRFYYDRSDGRIKTSSKLAAKGADHERH